jgi:uncharacterized protein YxjI
MSTTPANWYPDPTERHQHRYWDGSKWTDHVSDNGITGTDPVTPKRGVLDSIDQGLVVGNEGDKDKIQNQLYGTQKHRSAQVGDAAFAGQGTLFTEPILVVNQKAKIIELSNQFGIFDKDGNHIGAVNEVGQSSAKKAVRLLTSYDQFLTHKFEVLDSAGQVVLKLTRPAKIVKSSIIVSDPNDQEIGRIKQDNVFGKIHFSLEAGGYTYGSIRAENWRAWNFRVEDHEGKEVARITKTFEGVAKTIFTTADNYVVQIHAQMAQPLISLVVAAALTIDTALKQDDRGLN